MINGSFAERDLQLKASNASLPPYMRGKDQSIESSNLSDKMMTENYSIWLYTLLYIVTMWLYWFAAR